MSATLDSHLFANYFGGAPALAAGGRTFPVEQYFLEDAHDLIGYHLDAESNVAMRPNRDARSRRQLEAAAGGRERQGLLKVCLHYFLGPFTQSDPSYLSLSHGLYSCFVCNDDSRMRLPMGMMTLHLFLHKTRHVLWSEALCTGSRLTTMVHQGRGWAVG